MTRFFYDGIGLVVLLAFMLGALLLASLGGCSSVGSQQSAQREAQSEAQKRPDWINNPAAGVSASAGFHVRGERAQEELAITRARDEYAKRYGVVISSEHLTSQLVVGDRVSSVSAKEIREEVNQKEVMATVKAKWKDPDNGTLWVWLVPAD